MAEDIVLIVPTELTEFSDVILSAFRSSLLESKVDSKESVGLDQPRTGGFGGAEASELILWLGQGALLWLTKKWVETYLWPKIQDLIGQRSDELVDWIFSLPDKVSRQKEE